MVESNARFPVLATGRHSIYDSDRRSANHELRDEGLKSHA